MGIQGGPDIIEDGLVLYLDAANKRSYPGSGTPWTDLIGSNNGTLGGPTFSTDKFGEFIFDGIDDVVTGSDASNLTFGNGSTDSPFSIDQWIYRIGSQGAMGVVTKATSFNVGEWYTLYADGGLYFRIVDNSTGGYLGIFDSTQTSTGYYHIVATYSGNGSTSGMKLYVNGEQSSVTDSSSGTYIAMENTTAPFRLGERNDMFLSGSIFNVRVYNIELSEKNILQNYNALKSRFGL